ncbi:MAG: methylenetetrahydrofolate reductase C-terminal domain-containing protein [Pseudomonadota bacterium]
MILSEYKPIEEVLSLIGDKKRVFLIGCGDCASACRVGGVEDIPLYAEKLQDSGLKVIGWFVPERGCMLPRVKQELKPVLNEIDSSDVILSFSCGAGTQTLGKIFDTKIVLPAVNTSFLATTLRAGEFVQQCSLCGDCVLGITGGFCPQTLCAKSLMNGPCSGSVDGKCETYRDKDCVWHQIYHSLKERGELQKFQATLPMKDFSRISNQNKKSVAPQNIKNRKSGGRNK